MNSQQDQNCVSPTPVTTRVAILVTGTIVVADSLSSSSQMSSYSVCQSLLGAHLKIQQTKSLPTWGFHSRRQEMIKPQINERTSETKVCPADPKSGWGEWCVPSETALREAWPEAGMVARQSWKDGGSMTRQKENQGKGLQVGTRLVCWQVRGITQDEPWSLVDFGLDLTALKLYLDSFVQINGMVQFLFKTKKITYIFQVCEITGFSSVHRFFLI